MTNRTVRPGRVRRWTARLPAPVRRWLRPRRILAAGVVATLLLGAVVGGSVAWVHRAARGHIYDEQDVPPAPVALVLGAEVYPDGTPSPFLVARLALARRLYLAGKVRALLVSGDHSRWNYDEPDAMRRWLVDHDVPADKVVVDYAGFDTYQSCARARRIFGVRRAIVVSQDFHIPRAVALCRAVGIRTDGVGDSTARRHRLTYAKGWARDQVADVKAVYDMTVQPDPTFLGRHETGVQRAVADR